jgi:hypothetical protein
MSNTAKFEKYTETVKHLAACQGTDAPERAIRICFDAGVSATRAGKIIANALNNCSGERVYEYLSRYLNT